MICKYYSKFNNHAYCTNKNNLDINSFGDKNKRLRSKRCLPRFCPLSRKNYNNSKNKK